MGDNILVTGGAGYIGSHACKALAQAGFVPIAFDNLSTGWREAVSYGPLVVGDLMDRQALNAAFATWRPVAVMHFAALSLVGEAMAEPGRYWRVNVGGTLNLVEAALDADCYDFIFSSTCAVYGDQDSVVVTENSLQRPINAYGASKRAIEEMLGNFAVSKALRPTIFRYFNVAGADPDGHLGEQHRPETHLIPLMLLAIDGKRSALTLHGVDYPTRDGTCVRDYVHVVDLVAAHVLGLKRLLSSGAPGLFNLGTGHGFSVREVIEQAQLVTNRPVPLIEGPRRSGDAAVLVCGGDRARSELGWLPNHSTLPEMIADALRWSRGPGYAN